MATVRALAAGTLADDFRGNEQIEDSENVVTSARADNLRAWLPAIDDGAAATVDDGYAVLVQANSTGDVEIVDVFGRRVATVGAGESKLFTANGDLVTPVWVVTDSARLFASGAALIAAGSTTAALGTTCPAASATVKWVGIQLIDGTLGNIAVWS